MTRCGKSHSGQVVLDAKGLSCPAPLKRARLALPGLPPGAVLEVHATDPGAVQDFRVWVETGEAELIKVTETDGVYVFRLRRPIPAD